MDLPVTELERKAVRDALVEAYHCGWKHRNEQWLERTLVERNSLYDELMDRIADSSKERER